MQSSGGEASDLAEWPRGARAHPPSAQGGRPPTWTSSEVCPDKCKAEEIGQAQDLAAGNAEQDREIVCEGPSASRRDASAHADAGAANIKGDERAFLQGALRAAIGGEALGNKGQIALSRRLETPGREIEQKGGAPLGHARRR